MWAVVAVVVAAVLATVSGVYIVRARRRVTGRDDVFRCSVRTPPAAGERPRPPRRRSASYGEWVHDVLIVHHGLTLGAAAALPVRFPEGVIRPVLDDVTRSHEAVALRLRLDDGKVVQVATAPAVAE